MNFEILELITKLKEKCVLSENELRENADLSPAEYHALLNIEECETIKSNEFSEKMGLSPSRGSRVIDKLILKNYVKSKKSKVDKRAVVLCLTEEGIEIKKRINNLKCDCNDKILKNFSPTEIEEIQNSISKLLHVL